MLAFFVKSWGKWLLIAAVVAGLAWGVDHYRGKAEIAETQAAASAKATKAVEARETRLIEERKVLVENQRQWSAALVRIETLSRESASARAVEASRITNIAAALAAAKEGIKNAPGADDRFDFSDAAYGFVRGKDGAAGDRAGSGGGKAAPSAPVVGAR